MENNQNVPHQVIAICEIDYLEISGRHPEYVPHTYIGLEMFGNKDDAAKAYDTFMLEFSENAINSTLVASKILFATIIPQTQHSMFNANLKEDFYTLGELVAKSKEVK